MKASCVFLLSSSRALHSSLRSNPVRSLRSQIWQPTGGISKTAKEAGYEKLVRAGYVRQSSIGTFNILPLGLRVQEKIEQLLDTSMARIGASKVSLSSMTAQELWERSGRLQQVGPELFKFEDRRHFPFLLSPTHEEEITHMVAKITQSYKDLPLRLYQISRKYRDELRPRHGLLRTREFMMKDLYTFDLDLKAAIDTYHQVRAAYHHFFSQLNVPFLVAEASCGDMGGSMSHEYHMPCNLGEDTVVSCRQCGYSANEEVADTEITTRHHPIHEIPILESPVAVWRGVSKNRDTLINVWYRPNGEDTAPVNIHAIRTLVPDLDASIEDPTPIWMDLLEKRRQNAPSTKKLKLVNLLDFRIAHLAASLNEGPRSIHKILPPDSPTQDIPQSLLHSSPAGNPLNLMRIQSGDPCPRCETGTVEVAKTLELGHTFHLGTRYSDPMAARVSPPFTKSSKHTSHALPMQMGCFGIGITRIIGAIAEGLADEKGLIWPLSIAPYQVIIVPDTDLVEEAGHVYDSIAIMPSVMSTTFPRTIDALLDDRSESMPWKLKDADLAGYPVVVVLGRAWRESRGFNLDSLDPQQLSQVKKQIEGELDHLGASFAQLHTAQAKFKECLRCVEARFESSQSVQSVLVPLTNSLYVRGELPQDDRVMRATEARDFYKARSDELAKTLQDLESILQRKTTNVQVIEDVMRKKILESS
ncbi:hypothetical protein jhhlp_001144 [Lomentospora prolificans]|uniref:proline--tRNA ligase n=1 Tax=Lomentospora prolificans TaxID=41688 RepID=A0A2N3NHE2_9PEZI|nr:hypothetical protein jhhlp_001144 [Lomentospora prolificans]